MTKTMRRIGYTMRFTARAIVGPQETKLLRQSAVWWTRDCRQPIMLFLL